MPSSLSLNLPMLSELSLGEVYVNGVPLVGNAFQVNARGRNATADLVLRVGEKAVGISRVDGKNLQIDFHKPTGLKEPRTERVVVLGNPIAELVMFRSVKEHVWLPDSDGLDVKDEDGLDSFMNIASGWALRNQERQAEPNELAS